MTKTPSNKKGSKLDNYYEKLRVFELLGLSNCKSGKRTDNRKRLQIFQEITVNGSNYKIT